MDNPYGEGLPVAEKVIQMVTEPGFLFVLTNRGRMFEYIAKVESYEETAPARWHEIIGPDLEAK